MSTSVPEPTPAPAPAPNPAPGPEGQPPHGDGQKDDTVDWKALSRQWEARAKANADAAKKLQTIEDAAKTAEQRQAETIAAQEVRIKAFEAKEQQAEWRAKVAQDSGVPADVLAGSSLEEIEAHAAKLKPLLADTSPYRPIANVGKTPRNPEPSNLAFIRELFNQ